VWVRVLLDGVLQLTLLDPEIEETLREDLHVARLVEGLGREKALGAGIRGGVDQPRGGRERTTLAHDELHCRTDRILAENVVLHEERTSAARRDRDGFEVAEDKTEPVLNREADKKSAIDGSSWPTPRTTGERHGG
jgi:hypothetical protein